jgi:hypothetical protein
MFPIMVCNTKKCRGKSTHLSLKVTLCKKVEHPYKAGMVKKILSKIEYKFLYYATKCVQYLYSVEPLFQKYSNQMISITKNFCISCTLYYSKYAIKIDEH